MRRARKKASGGKVNHERWLITYSDLITLLLIFFVIMYAMSSINVAKFLSLSESLNAAFDPSNQIPLHNLGKTALLQSQNPTAGHQTGFSLHSLSKQQDQQLRQVLREDQVFSHLFSELQNFVQRNHLSHSVSLANEQRGIQITLKDVVLFNTGEDTVLPAARRILQGLIPFFHRVPNNIVVEGFTDNVPIDTPQFPSNWELSTGRAVTVVRDLIDAGVAPQRLAATGYGQYHPVAPNNSAAHRQMNRRVNIVILRSTVSALTEPQGSGGPAAGSYPVTQSLLPNPHTLISHNETTHTARPALPKSLFGSGSAPTGNTP